MKYSVLCTDPDGTYHVYGPFYSESAAEKAQAIIDLYTDSDTQIIPMSKYRRTDFNIYT